MIRTNSQIWMHFSLACFIAFALAMSACGTEDMNLRSLGLSKKSSSSGDDAAALAGNGAPSGKHFSLNLIGVPKNKTATITSGNRIFLPLEGTAKVNLSQGDFQVLDANGTDGVAAFQLPAPDADGDGVTSYSVFARALGKPNGSIKANTCASDVVSGELVCSLETLVQIRNKGKSTFSNVSRELLSISADIDGDGTVERVPLFDSRLQDFFWSLDNQGLKLLQLRFVEVPTKF